MGEHAGKEEGKIKRAIAISGGGPTVGIAIGALKALQKENIQFDVYTCACIGSWAACIYLSKTGKESEEGIQHLTEVYENSFRNDKLYESYPFADFFQFDPWHYAARSLQKFFDPDTYQNLLAPLPAFVELAKKWAQKPVLNLSDMKTFLNDFLPLHPYARFLNEIIWKSQLCGLVNQPDAEALAKDKIDFERLCEAEPFVYTNAYNLNNHELEMFANKDKKYNPITAETLMAGSSLPYIYEPRRIGKDWYCEGATVDTVNFKDLVKNHKDLDEVWVLKIVDYQQLEKPDNLVEGLSNFPMIFANTVGDDDIKLFRYHLLEEGKLDTQYDEHEVRIDGSAEELKLWRGKKWPPMGKETIKLITIRVNYGRDKNSKVNFEWNQGNLHKGITVGEESAMKRIKDYRNYCSHLSSSK